MQAYDEAQQALVGLRNYIRQLAVEYPSDPRLAEFYRDLAQAEEHLQMQSKELHRIYGISIPTQLSTFSGPKH